MRKEPFRFHSLMHSADLLERRLDTLLSSLAVKPRQARVLSVINRLGAVSQTLLAKEMGVTAGSMSTMVARLQAAGLIQRHEDHRDRRVDVLSLTEGGQKVLVEIRDVWREMDLMIADALGQEKAHLLAELTAELKHVLGGRIAGAGWERRSPEAPHLPERFEEDHD